MKRKILAVLLLAVSIFAKTELSLNLGTNSFDSDENLKTPTTLDIRGDFYLDNMYHIDFGYVDLGDVYFDNSSILTPVDIKRFYTQFSADGEEEYHVVPTLSLGVGYEKQKGIGSNSNPYVSLGVGFRFNVSNNFNFLLGTKALLKTSPRAINYHSTFGVGYLIDEAPINNKVKEEDIVIPKQKLRISELYTNKKTKPVQIQATPKITDVKIASVNNQNNSYKVIQTPPPLQNDIQPIEAMRKVQQVSVLHSLNKTYIQVAAFSINRPTNILDRLANSGYHIILRHQGNITKALVGPYNSRAEALQVLPKVKKVVPQAFIYKGK